MWQFAALGGVMIAAGLGIGLYFQGPFTAGAWFTGGLLVLFAFVARSIALRDSAPVDTGK